MRPKKPVKPSMTLKQKAFADYYIETGNASEAAKKAGYKEDNARQMGAENLTKPIIRDYIAARMKEIEGARVASANEVMKFYTAVMRGEEKDQFGLDASLDTRINAGKELMKRLAIAEKANENEKAVVIIDV